MTEEEKRQQEIAAAQSAAGNPAPADNQPPQTAANPLEGSSPATNTTGGDNAPAAQTAAPGTTTTETRETVIERPGLGDIIQAREKRYNDLQQRAADLVAKAERDKQEGRSYMSAFIQEQKPVYDQNREKRLRQASMIMALGNMLSAAFGAASGYKGAHYAAPIDTSGPLAMINEISRMQQEYQRRGERWKVLELEQKKNALKEDLAASDAMAAMAAKEAAAERQSINDLILEDFRRQDEWSRQLSKQQAAADLENVKHGHRMKEGEQAGKYQIAAANIRNNKKTGGYNGQRYDNYNDAAQIYLYGIAGGIIPKDNLGTTTSTKTGGGIGGAEVTTKKTKGDFSWAKKSGVQQDAYLERTEKWLEATTRFIAKKYGVSENTAAHYLEDIIISGKLDSEEYKDIKEFSTKYAQK